MTRRHTISWQVWVTGLLLLALVGVGCGDSAESGEADSGPAVVTSAASLTKAELIEQADAICAKEVARRGTKLKPFVEKSESELTKKEKETVILTILIPSFLRDAQELAKLGAPSGEVKTVQAIVDAIENGAARVEADPLSLLAGASKQFGKAEKLAGQYGFTVCGRT